MKVSELTYMERKLYEPTWKKRTKAAAVAAGMAFVVAFGSCADLLYYLAFGI